MIGVLGQGALAGGGCLGVTRSVMAAGRHADGPAATPGGRPVLRAGGSYGGPVGFGLVPDGGAGDHAEGVAGRGVLRKTCSSRSL
jgi:hypothetical protein